MNGPARVSSGRPCCSDSRLPEPREKRGSTGSPRTGFDVHRWLSSLLNACSRPPLFRFPIPDSRLPTPESRIPNPDSRFPIPDSRLPIPDSRFPIPDSRFPTPDSRFPIPDSRFPIPDSRIPNPDSRFPIPDSRLPIPDSRFPIPDSRFPIPESRIPIPDSRLQISTCAPSSTMRLRGRRKKSVNGLALRAMKANTLSRHVAIPGWREATTRSWLRK